MTRVLAGHGPNLNLLGTREPQRYGSRTLQAMDDGLFQAGREWGMDMTSFQSNHEDDIVEAIQKTPVEGYGAIINDPAAFTHTSVAIRDARAGHGLSFVEVHISNVHAGEAFRQESLVSDIASGVVLGFGPTGCRLALMGLRDLLASGKDSGEESS